MRAQEAWKSATWMHKPHQQWPQHAHKMCCTGEQDRAVLGVAVEALVEAVAAPTTVVATADSTARSLPCCRQRRRSPSVPLASIGALRTSRSDSCSVENCCILCGCCDRTCACESRQRDICSSIFPQPTITVMGMVSIAIRNSARSFFPTFSTEHSPFLRGITCAADKDVCSFRASVTRFHLCCNGLR